MSTYTIRSAKRRLKYDLIIGSDLNLAPVSD